MEQCSLTPLADLTIANTVSDLIQGDIREHLPLERIPLKGDVLGLGTTSSLENGELSFLRNASGNSDIWRCIAHNGSIIRLQPGDGSGHFPYVCFTGDVTALRHPVDLGPLKQQAHRPTQELISAAIEQECKRGALAEAPIYGIRLLAHWDELVITVASKLFMGQQQRNHSFSRDSDAGSRDEHLRHTPALPPGATATREARRSDPLSRQIDAMKCCGFFDCEPERGRVTVPKAGDHLHLHGCSTDLAYGGHVLHDHPNTRLGSIEQLVLYPLQTIESLCSDLAIQTLTYRDEQIHFSFSNAGALDVSDVGVAVVVDDRFSDHRYLQIPWMNAGASESYSLSWPLPPGEHSIAVIADPQELVIEPRNRRQNNRMDLKVNIP